ncbi:Ig-like domain-containing protein [Testudinibacter sp. TR-2022]|uniref:Ig-like domain-containing protein n=1 Tax=Testudinibacter sp. TR-2022 TaxID=2585029 RepID=UPI002278B5E4|nr:Ig-like domain-containing protein [Testudinibacter sp. TR-2022]
MLPTLTVDVADTINATNASAVPVSGASDLPNGSEVKITLTDAEGNTVTVTATVTDGKYATTVDASGLKDGAITATASSTATDAAGNAPADATDTTANSKDSSAPTLSIDPISEGYINAAEAKGDVAISGTTTAEAGQTVTVTLNGKEYTAVVGNDGTWTATVPAADVAKLPQGLLEATASVKDLAGNPASDKEDVTVDTVLPALTAQLDSSSDSGISNSDAITNDNTPTIKGTGEVGASIEVVVGGQTLKTTVGQDGTWSVTPTALTDGDYTALVTAKDVAGNTSTENVSVTIDTVSILTVNVANTINDDNVTAVAVSGTADVIDGGTVTVTLTDKDGKTVEVTAVVTDGAYATTADLSSLANGAITAVASSTATDEAGNTPKAATDTTANTKETSPNLEVTSLTVPNSVNEGSNAVFTVSLVDGHKGGTIAAPVLGGSASADDYGKPTYSNGVTVDSTGKLVIPAGVTSFTISYPIVADQLTEGNETLSMDLGGKSAETTINDTSLTTLSISVADPVQRENDSSAGSVMTFTVTASKPVVKDTEVTIDLGGQATVPGKAGADYVLAGGTVSGSQVTVIIKAGETKASFTVDPINDALSVTSVFGGETNESVIATLKLPSGYVLSGSGVAEGMIIDSQPFAIPFLDADFNLMTGIVYPDGDNTKQLLEGPSVAMGSDYDDSFYVGYWLNGTVTGSLGNVSNSGASGENYDSSMSITTVDLGQGNDLLKIRGNQQALSRVYMGEGNDSYEVGSMIGAPGVDSLKPHVFMESGNDTVVIRSDVLAGFVYAGSGSDNVTVQGDLDAEAVIDLGSGRSYSSNYETTYTNGLSLGNDNNTDLATDVNTLLVQGDMGFTTGINAKIYGGAGQDSVTIGGVVSGGSGTLIDLGSGNDTLVIGQLGRPLSGGATINMGTGADKVNITTMTDGVVNTGTDTDIDTVKIGTMSGGTINMGAGDIIEVGKMSGGKVNGSSATDDTLTITGTGSTISASNVFGVENVDLGAGNRINIYKPAYNDALDKTNGQTAMYIQGNSTSTVDLGDSIGQYDSAAVATWSKGAAVTVDGHTYDTWSIGGGLYGGTQTIYIEQGIQIV